MTLDASWCGWIILKLNLGKFLHGNVLFNQSIPCHARSNVVVVDKAARSECEMWWWMSLLLLEAVVWALLLTDVGAGGGMAAKEVIQFTPWAEVSSRQQPANRIAKQQISPNNQHEIETDLYQTTNKILSFSSKEGRKLYNLLHSLLFCPPYCPVRLIK